MQSTFLQVGTLMRSLSLIHDMLIRNMRSYLAQLVITALMEVIRRLNVQPVHIGTMNTVKTFQIVVFAQLVHTVLPSA